MPDSPAIRDGSGLRARLASRGPSAEPDSPETRVHRVRPVLPEPVGILVVWATREFVDWTAIPDHPDLQVEWDGPVSRE